MPRKPQNELHNSCRNLAAHITSTSATHKPHLPRRNCRWQFVKCLTSRTSSTQFGKLSWIFGRCLSGDTTRCQVIFIFRVMTRFKKEKQQEATVPVKSLTRTIRKITAAPQNKSKLIANLLNSKRWGNWFNLLPNFRRCHHCDDCGTKRHKGSCISNQVLQRWDVLKLSCRIQNVIKIFQIILRTLGNASSATKSKPNAKQLRSGKIPSSTRGKIIQSDNTESAWSTCDKFN